MAAEMQQKSRKNNLIITQDIKLAKVLAGNNKKLRDRALNRLKKWFELRSRSMPFTELDFMRIWKGLFYSLWMSDKPLIQEECAESIANLLHFIEPETSLLFFKCGLQTLCNEWFGIDQLRLAKFLLFVRRFLRQGLMVVKNNSWSVNLLKTFNKILLETVLNNEQEPPVGLTMHFIEIYLEEVAKVSRGELKLHLLTEMLRPFVGCLALSNDSRKINCMKQHIFHYLIKQSDAGFEYQEKFKAWQKEGFPGNSIDAMQKQTLPNDGNETEPDIENGPQILDPRAGHVDVELPQLRFSTKQIIQLLAQHKFVKGSSLKSRKAIAALINDFTELAKGNYPLGTKTVELPEEDNYSMRTKHAVNRLVKFERKLLGKTKKRKRPPTDTEADESPTPKKRKKMSEDFAARFAEFVKKSEACLPKRNIKKRQQETNNFGKYEFSFRRNSGTWFVYGADSSLDQSAEEKQDSPQVLTFNSSSTPNGQKTFAQNDWDVPPINGDDEQIFLVKNPFSETKSSPSSSLKKVKINLKQGTKSSPSSSSKKVKINLKQNRSQEIHEHVARIKSSPGIPFDANKKPSKPLLKMTGVSSPINPFYKRTLKL